MNIETPCRSIGEALNAIIYLYENDLIERLAARIILLRDVSGSLVYSYQQCHNFDIYSKNIIFEEVVISSLNDTETISIDCFHAIFIIGTSGVTNGFRKLTFSHIHMKRMRFYWNENPLQQVSFQHVTLVDSRFEEEYIFMPDIIKKALIIEASTIQKSSIQLRNNFSLEIANSTMMMANISIVFGANIVISSCHISNFEFKVLTKDVFLSSPPAKIQNYGFIVENSYIENSNFRLYGFNEIKFKNTHLYATNSIYQLFSFYSMFSNVVARSGRLHMWLDRVNDVSMSNCNFDSLSAINSGSPLLKISSCSSLTLIGIISSNNMAPLISVSTGQVVYINHFTAYNNQDGPCLKAELGQIIGGTLFRINDFNFTNNKCSSNGCAIYVEADEIQMDNGQLMGNQGKNGGALFVRSKELRSIIINFFNNVALSKGGAVFVDSPTVSFVACRCDGNMAYFSGGCVYSQQPIPRTELYIFFNNNVAKSYGNNVGTEIQVTKYQMKVHYGQFKVITFKSNYTSVPEIFLYPGQELPSIDLEIWDVSNTKILFLESPLRLKLNDTSQGFSIYNQNNSNTLSLESLQVTINNASQQVLNTNIFIDDHTSISIPINILPCPENKTLEKTLNGFVCMDRPHIPYEIVVPTVSILTLILAGIIIIGTYGITRIVNSIASRLRTLKEKEQAEKRMETKLIEKRVVLMSHNEDHEIHTEYHTMENAPLLINSTSDGGSSNSKPKTTPRYTNWIISINEIEIIKRIAEGGNGTVYLASWNGNKVALKSLKSTGLAGDEGNGDLSEDDEFEKEAAVLGSMRHPNIVQFFGVILAGKNKYMVVEYLEKGSLDKLIHASKTKVEPLDMYRKIDILLGVAKGMHYLHSLKPKGIIHRDLKPANILLDNNFTAKICDFGLSKAWSDSCTNSVTTNIGTLFYMANEMIGGDSSYNHKVDVFSFAIIMWELFFEENPYLNSQSEKLFKFMERQDGSADTLGVNVLFRVMQGARPIIPFQTEDQMKQWVQEYMHDDHTNSKTSLETLYLIIPQYIELMKECWNSNYHERPEFGEICTRLTRLMTS
ncbi:hypothetical protein C9374_013776 [Naegleria lovaniensis]|uniref:Protein kinase domain-containing protein n=1 Tax=Naegleria lovaniensis TaxID=51637 RepID=A0AA88GDE2_NAELO|nr:uncharacterized protein C9374_013776 [Naegleria lovaniensis]KAG2370865.1 hypothetical protein C9374_013776 [Naegleria lovaniensis]